MGHEFYKSALQKIPPAKVQEIRTQRSHEEASKMKIVIRGNKKYIDYLHKHLKKEHPSTRKRMRVED